MSSATKRSILRWIHIVLGIPIIGYIYSPFDAIRRRIEEGPAFGWSHTSILRASRQAGKLRSSRRRPQSAVRP
jgi:hypothetical protein